MTPTEFRAWLERRGLTYKEAAPLLAAHPNEVERWANGRRKVLRRVERIMDLLDEIDRLRERLEPETRTAARTGRIQQAAREASAAEGKNISASEWVRIACEEKLEREDKNG
ncbi:MAG TPA: hypothetical protein VF167_08440 [Longimicrobiaceae bacterium]